MQEVKYIPERKRSAPTFQYELTDYVSVGHACFITFVDPNAAVAFFTMASHQGIVIRNKRLRIGWGKQSGPTPAGIAMAVHSGGSRNGESSTLPHRTSAKMYW